MRLLKKPQGMFLHAVLLIDAVYWARREKEGVRQKRIVGNTGMGIP